MAGVGAGTRLIGMVVIMVILITMEITSIMAAIITDVLWHTTLQEEVQLMHQMEICLLQEDEAQ
jgi:hypothetical protein